MSDNVERCQWLTNYLFPGVGLCAFGLWGLNVVEAEMTEYGPKGIITNNLITA